MEFFEVGGCVRDEIMGRASKDIDFVCVLSDEDKRLTKKGAEQGPFFVMVSELERRGFRIFQRNEKFLTVRAQFPRGLRPGMVHFERSGLTADFVLARKDGISSDGRRPDEVMPGSLMDDLARRDFTMNAIAKDRDFHLLDPFGGQTDIANRIIRCVGSAEDRIFEDALRGLRAMRFSVTLGFHMHFSIVEVMQSPEFAEALSSVSKERQREEMEKMFAHDTVASMLLLHRFPAVMAVVFSDGLRLSATMKG